MMKVYLDFHEQLLLYQHALSLSAQLLNAIKAGDFERYAVYQKQYNRVLNDIKKVKADRPLHHHELREKLNVLSELLEIDRAISNIIYPSLKLYLSGERA